MARLRIVHSTAPSDQTIFHANALLSSGQPSSVSLALKLYTQVLYDECPGHICALLNRALAYIALGYPELAVADAHRAAQICHEARSVHKIKEVTPDSPKNKKHKKDMPPVVVEWKFREPKDTKGLEITRLVEAVHDYMRAERFMMRKKEPWTLEPACWVRRPFVKWLQSDLASIVLADFGLERAKRPVFETLENRAVFRIVGTLWLCGGGAIMDGIGLVSDALDRNQKTERWIMSGDEMEDFNGLGNAMLADVCKQMTNDKEGTDGIMKTRSTMVNRVIYPWNTIQPNMNNFAEREELERACDKVAEKCTVRHNEATETAPCALYLVAATDIAPKEQVLSELSLLHVVTPCKEYFKCDVCAARLVLGEDRTSDGGDDAGGRMSRTASTVTDHDWSEQELQLSKAKDDDYLDFSSSPTEEAELQTESDHHVHKTSIANASAETASKKSGSSGESDHRELSSDSLVASQILQQTATAALTEEGEDVEMEDAEPLEEHIRSGAPSPNFTPSRNRKKKEMDFKVCEACKSTLFCTSTCALLSDDTHCVACGSDLDEGPTHRLGVAMRNYDQLKTAIANEMVHPKITYLQHQMLVKIVGLAEAREQHPLELEEIKWINGGLFKAPDMAAYKEHVKLDDYIESNTAPGTQAKTLRWSYDANVVIPFRLMSEIGLDPWDYPEKYDGWVLNTLFAKLDHSLYITQGFRHVKTYNDEGDLINDLTDGGQDIDKDTWVGSLHPFGSLIRQAKHWKGEEPNVVFEITDMLECKAALPDVSEGFHASTPDEMDMEIDDDKKRVAIETCEPVLRSPDFRFWEGKPRSYSSSVASNVGKLTLGGVDDR